MPQDEASTIVSADLEVPMARLKPAIENFLHREAPLAERESARLLLAPISRMRFDAQPEMLI